MAQEIFEIKKACYPQQASTLSNVFSLFSYLYSPLIFTPSATTLAGAGTGFTLA